MDIELGNVCKRWLLCSFIYYSPEEKENVMLSVYTARRHVGWEVKLHSFLASSMGVGVQVHNPAALPPLV